MYFFKCEFRVPFSIGQGKRVCNPWHGAVIYFVRITGYPKCHETCWRTSGKETKAHVRQSATNYSRKLGIA